MSHRVESHKHVTETKDHSDSFDKFFTKGRIIILILLILILAFAVRGHLLKYDSLYSFDPYWHIRAVGYILQGGLPAMDPLSFYHQGVSYAGRPTFFWYVTVLIYIIFTLGASYHKQLLMEFARVLPAVFGALISVAMYYLGKEMYNKKVGLVMGVIAATIPAFVYRTMAGFFEDDSLGFLWMVLGLIYFVKSIKHIHARKKSIKYAVISSVFFAVMSFTWGLFLLVPLVLVAYFIINIIYMAYKNSTNLEIASFVKIFTVVFVLFVAMASLYNGTGWINKTTQYVTKYIPISHSNIARVDHQNLPNNDVVGATVGEENTGKQFFLLKYNFSVIVLLLLLLIPLYLLFYKKKDYMAAIIFSWLAITAFMAWSKLKFTYPLGLSLAAGAGFLFYFLNELINKKENNLKLRRAFGIFMIFFLLISVAAGTFFVSTKVPPIDQAPNWHSSMLWLYNNTPKDAKIFNWWDYGHWIAYFSERKVATDNTNARLQGDSDVAKFIITGDLNKAKSIIKDYNADYFIADSSYINRYNSFALYAYITTNFSDPRVTQYLGRTITCQKGYVAGTGLVHNCGGQNYSDAQFNKFADKWTSEPTTILNNSTPIVVYRSKDGSEIYVVNMVANNSMFTKIWMNSPDANFMSLVHQAGNVRIYKINKNLLN